MLVKRVWLVLLGKVTSRNGSVASTTAEVLKKRERLKEILLLLLLLLYWKITGCGNDPKEPKDPSFQCRQTQERFLNTGIKTKLRYRGETRLPEFQLG